jgi:hypothetical protein
VERQREIDNIWKVLKELPPSYINSARAIVKPILEGFVKFRNHYFARRLEDYGIDVDYSPYDNGN